MFIDIEFVYFLYHNVFNNVFKARENPSTSTQWKFEKFEKINKFPLIFLTDVFFNERQSF